MECDGNGVDAGNGVHEVVCLVDDDNVVLEGQVQCLPSRSLEKKLVWKSDYLMIGLANKHKIAFLGLTSLCLTTGRVA